MSEAADPGRLACSQLDMLWRAAEGQPWGACVIDPPVAFDSQVLRQLPWDSTGFRTGVVERYIHHMDHVHSVLLALRDRHQGKLLDIWLGGTAIAEPPRKNKPDPALVLFLKRSHQGKFIEGDVMVGPSVLTKDKEWDERQRDMFLLDSSVFTAAAEGSVNGLPLEQQHQLTTLGELAVAITAVFERIENPC